jgi:hypothetical protein
LKYINSTSSIYSSTNESTWAGTTAASYTVEYKDIYKDITNNLCTAYDYACPKISTKPSETDDSSFWNYTNEYITETLYSTIPAYMGAVISNDYPTKRETDRFKLRQNLIPQINVRGDGFNGIIEDHEQIAVETLREEITEQELRKYLRYGFILVKGASGKTYQIFRNSWHTKVWLGGKLVEEICVRLDSTSKVPPTDNVIAFKHMLETDESEFRQCGNVYNMQKRVAA